MPTQPETTPDPAPTDAQQTSTPAVPDIIVSENSELSICVAKKGLHSFIMVVVVDPENETPRILARIGKGSEEEMGALFFKAIFSHADARLKNEMKPPAPAEEAAPPATKSKSRATVSYEAYRLTLGQYMELLTLLKNIQAEQASADLLEGRQAPSAIACYTPKTPSETNETKWTFEYKTISEFQSSNPQLRDHKALLARASRISVLNTCRTSAHDLLTYALGFKKEIPRLFAQDFRYRMQFQGATLKKGALEHTYYVLPIPPMMNNSVDKSAQKILNAIYQRLEAIPKVAPRDPATQKKFKALKKIYDEMTPKLQAKLSVTDLINIVDSHLRAASTSRSALFARRAPNPLSRLLNLKSTTETMLTRMQNKLKK